MEKASKERQTLKNIKNLPIKTRLTIPITTTTISVTTKQHRNKNKDEDEEISKNKTQQHKKFDDENHENQQKIRRKEKCNTETATATACNAAAAIKMATEKPTAKAKSLYRKSKAKTNKNSNKNYKNNAFKENERNFQAEKSTRLLPYIAKAFATTKANYKQEIRRRRQRRRQQQQQEQLEQQPQLEQQQLTLAETAITKAYYNEFDLLSKCSRNASIQYNSSSSKNVDPTNCYSSNSFNSIKITNQMPLKSSSKLRKLLRYIAMSKFKNSSSYNNSKSNSISISNINYNLDLRSFIYATLFILIYCTVLIRASATAANDSTYAAFLQSTKSSKQNPQLAINISQNNIFPETKIVISSNSSSSSNSNATINPSLSMVYRNLTNSTHRLHRRDAANVPDDDDDSSYHDDEFDEYDALIRNKSAKGKYIGAPCDEMKCDSTLLHVTCDKETLTCGCEKNYPVQLGLTKGCGKPKKLGEQCFYDVTCMFNDENSLCVQVRHNALCQCASGFHSVSYTKPTRRVFCTQDLKELTSDLPTLLGVTTGIAVLAGLICMVLHLFSKTKYPRHRNFGDASIPPPIMYSSDTEFDMPTRFPGIPLIVQSGRPSSRSSLRSSGSIGSYGNRRSSSGGVIGGVGGGGIGIGAGGAGSGTGSKGILVSTSRTGSRRPSLASVHSTSSSVRSYSMMRFEKETQQKEIRQEMKLRLARLQQQQQMSQNRPQIIIGDALTMLSGRSEHAACGSSAMTAFSRLAMATPSPLTPNSTDELLPVVHETQEYPPKSEMLPMTSTKPKPATAPTIVAAATLTAVQEIATTSTMALAAAAAAAARANVAENINENSITEATEETQQSRSTPISEAGAYIGPCTSSTEAL